MLHITNGDAAARVMARAGLPGEILVWRDVLHDGPVPAGLGLPDLSEVRARYIAECGWGDADAVLAELRERDARLAGSGDHDEVVLWFEHDLYDQLQLLQVLDWFSSAQPASAALRMVCEAEYLGPSTPERIRERFQGRGTVSEGQLHTAAYAWTAFRSPTPDLLAALPQRDTSELPFLRAAALRLLEEYPSLEEGLSRTERRILEGVAAGVTKPRALFLETQRREEPRFLGDASFFVHLRGLMDGEHPLVVVEGGNGERIAEGTLRLTDDGRDVLEGNADRVRLRGIDRWIGGVHLTGRRAWRWSRGEGRIVGPL